MNDDSRTPAPGPRGGARGGCPILAALAGRPDLWALVDAYIDLVRNRPDLVPIFDKRFPPSVVAQDARTRQDAEQWLRTHLGA